MHYAAQFQAFNVTIAKASALKANFLALVESFSVVFWPSTSARYVRLSPYPLEERPGQNNSK